MKYLATVNDLYLDNGGLLSILESQARLFDTVHIAWAKGIEFTLEFDSFLFDKIEVITVGD